MEERRKSESEWMRERERVGVCKREEHVCG